MSWRATAYVKKLGADRVTRAEKLLMFVLADQYLDDRKQAHPQSVAELAADALMSERQARRSLRALEQKGLLLTLCRRGREHTNFYRFLDLEGGDTSTPFDAGKPDRPSGFKPPLKSDALAPFDSAKSDITGHKTGHHGSENRTPRVVKSDIAMSAPIRNNRHRDKADETDKNSGPLSLFDFWNARCGPLPRALALTPDRIAKCQARLKAPEFAARFEQAISQAARTPFLLGRNERSWQATFDWMIANDSNILKILEGKYGKPAEAGAAEETSRNGQAGREREWRGWLLWAGSRPLDELRKALDLDLENYPSWARERAQEYLREREARPA